MVTWKSEEEALERAAEVAVILAAAAKKDAVEEPPAWPELVKSMECFAREGIGAARYISSDDTVPRCPAYSQLEYLCGQLAHWWLGKPTPWMDKILLGQVERTLPGVLIRREFSALIAEVARDGISAPEAEMEAAETPSLDITSALRKYGRDYEWGVTAWISVPHPDYPFGVDVNIEVDDDISTRDFGKLKAWVYPNRQDTEVVDGERVPAFQDGEPVITTDTQTLLAVFPESGWPAPSHMTLNDYVLFRWTTEDIGKLWDGLQDRLPRPCDWRPLRWDDLTDTQQANLVDSCAGLFDDWENAPNGGMQVNRLLGELLYGSLIADSSLMEPRVSQEVQSAGQ